jgi:hypothetical protein
MRKLAVIVVAGMLGATVYIAAPAGASVPSKSFCNSVESALSSVSSGSGSSDTSGLGDLAKLATALRKASKSAPKKIKKAMRTMAKYYDALSNIDTDNPLDGNTSDLTKTLAKFSAASTTFYTYVSETCGSLDLPNIPTTPSLPDLTGT